MLLHDQRGGNCEKTRIGSLSAISDVNPGCPSAGMFVLGPQGDPREVGPAANNAGDNERAVKVVKDFLAPEGVK